MKILHTSDWHLGRNLYGRKRYEEFTAFLNWLCETIESEGIDILLVAGDIFDTNTPSNRAQELYYEFLLKASRSCCKHIVVIAGNHDSPSFLNAPKGLLQALNVHVVGAMTDNPADEVIVLKNEENSPQAIICAVPYLRDRDIRTVEAGETIDDKNLKLIEGLKRHYADVCAVAEKEQASFQNESKVTVPIIGMGHLFTAGGKTMDGDGVRELYVGTLAHVGPEIFPSSLDYVALGHLHVPQSVGGQEHIRYCGSPIPMGYGEAKQQKKVIVVDFEHLKPSIESLAIPCFQPLERIVGNLDDIHMKLISLKNKQSDAWLEIEYTGDEVAGNLREMLEETLLDSTMEIRRIKNRRIIDRVLQKIQDDETLDDLNENDVFVRCLDSFKISADERPELIHSYNEIIQSLQEEDVNAE